MAARSRVIEGTSRNVSQFCAKLIRLCGSGLLAFLSHRPLYAAPFVVDSNVVWTASDDLAVSSLSINWPVRLPDGRSVFAFLDVNHGSVEEFETEPFLVFTDGSPDSAAVVPLVINGESPILPKAIWLFNFASRGPSLIIETEDHVYFAGWNGKGFDIVSELVLQGDVYQMFVGDDGALHFFSSKPYFTGEEFVSTKYWSRCSEDLVIDFAVLGPQTSSAVGMQAAQWPLVDSNGHLHGVGVHQSGLLPDGVTYSEMSFGHPHVSIINEVVYADRLGESSQPMATVSPGGETVTAIFHQWVAEANALWLYRRVSEDNWVPGELLTSRNAVLAIPVSRLYARRLTRIHVGDSRILSDAYFLINSYSVGVGGQDGARGEVTLLSHVAGTGRWEEVILSPFLDATYLPNQGAIGVSSASSSEGRGVIEVFLAEDPGESAILRHIRLLNPDGEDFVESPGACIAASLGLLEPTPGQVELFDKDESAFVDVADYIGRHDAQ